VNKKNIIKGIIVAAIAAVGVGAFIYLKKKVLAFLNAKPEPTNDE